MPLKRLSCVAEIIAVDELYQAVAKHKGQPIVVFNGEFDRLRAQGYYPGLFYPKLSKLAKTFIPNFQSAYYIHNFKGERGGTPLYLCPLADILHGLF